MSTTQDVPLAECQLFRLSHRLNVSSSSCLTGWMLTTRAVPLAECQLFRLSHPLNVSYSSCLIGWMSTTRAVSFAEYALLQLSRRLIAIYSTPAVSLTWYRLLHMSLWFLLAVHLAEWHWFQLSRWLRATPAPPPKKKKEKIRPRYKVGRLRALWEGRNLS